MRSLRALSGAASVAALEASDAESQWTESSGVAAAVFVGTVVDAASVGLDVAGAVAVPVEFVVGSVAAGAGAGLRRRYVTPAAVANPNSTATSIQTHAGHGEYVSTTA